MSGPRDLRRGGVKLWEPPASTSEIVGRKSHYVASPTPHGWRLVINRYGEEPQVEDYQSEGALHRRQRELSDQGLIGRREGGQ